MEKAKKHPKILRGEKGINKHLFIICGIVTIAMIVMKLIEFFTRGAFPSTGMKLFYLAVLVIYSLHKEALRWFNRKSVQRQGEIFVYGWIILTTLLYIINFAKKDYFRYSASGQSLEILNDLTIITIEVLAVFVLTRGLKLLRVIFRKK